MNLLRSFRFISCLIKCGKYLYFAKKMLCIVTLLFTAFVVIDCFSGEGKGRKKMISKLKAVM